MGVHRALQARNKEFVQGTAAGGPLGGFPFPRQRRGRDSEAIAERAHAEGRRLTGNERNFRAQGRHNDTDTVLRHQVCVILGFFGLRRKSKIFLAADGRLGLRVGHIALVRGSHVRLFVAGAKNDPYNQGDVAPLSWVSTTGIRIGEIFAHYLARLRDSWIKVTDALICKTGWESGRYKGFVAPAQGKCFMPDDCFRTGLKMCFTELKLPENAHVLSGLAWHSLRRGGATAAFNAGGGIKGVCTIGLWRSEQGAMPYALASFETKLAVAKLL
eukprot:2992213-Rhodomonas_salina.2